MQKTEEPKKPFQTGRTDVKISVRFRFGSVSVSVSFYKKPKISVRFSVSNFNTPNRPNRTEILIYNNIINILLYYIIILNIKYFDIL